MTTLIEPRTGYTDVVLKFGQNPDIDTAAAEDIWDGGGTWVPPTAARVHNLASSDVNDTAAGTGARTVQVYGLDSDYLPIDETVTLNGTSNVATTNSYLRLFRMIVRTAGSGGVNAGIVTATAVTDATVTAQISVSNNQTLMAIYTVPAAKICHLYQYDAAMNKGNATGAADIQLLVRPFGEVWQVKRVRGLIASGGSSFIYQFAFPLRLDEKSDIKIRATVSANNTDISAGFDLVNIPPYS